MTRLEAFLRSRKIRPIALAREGGTARQHLAKIRAGRMEARQGTIAAIVSALRRMTLEPITADDVFELTAEESVQRQLRQDILTTRRAADDAASQFVQTHLTGTSDHEWSRQLRAYSRTVDVSLIRTLVISARDAIDSDATRAAALARFAIALARQLPDEPNTLHLRGVAGVQYANALRHLGSYDAGLDALQHAEADLLQNSAAANELAQAWYVRAVILWKRGEAAAAAVSARRAAVLFELLGDERRIAYTRIVEASIAFDGGDAAHARAVLRATLPALVALKDYRAIAAAWLSLGTAEGQLGSVAEATRLLLNAEEAFRRLRVPAERVRARWSRGYFTALHENDVAGMAVLREAALEFERMRMPTEAAFVHLDIAELLLLRGPEGRQEAIATCRAVYVLFTSAGVRAAAEKALAYLRDAAATDRANPALVRSVRSFVRDAERNPHAEVVFAAEDAT